MITYLYFHDIMYNKWMSIFYIKWSFSTIYGWVSSIWNDHI